MNRRSILTCSEIACHRLPFSMHLSSVSEVVLIFMLSELGSRDEPATECFLVLSITHLQQLRKWGLVGHVPLHSHRMAAVKGTCSDLNTYQAGLKQGTRAETGSDSLCCLSLTLRLLPKDILNTSFSN
ncbi:hypothetical protein NQZ68_016465 [Dissostichus eleginoides]|nr:hypothetical protein NQZ68_016465 [Dissostichus eleginoides]